MEEELAACKLKIAELEAAKDDLEIELEHRKKKVTLHARPSTLGKENAEGVAAKPTVMIRTGFLSLLS
jgi:hypothetical protein